MYFGDTAQQECSKLKASSFQLICCFLKSRTSLFLARLQVLLAWSFLHSFCVVFCLWKQSLQTTPYWDIFKSCLNTGTPPGCAIGLGHTHSPEYWIVENTIHSRIWSLCNWLVSAGKLMKSTMRLQAQVFLHLRVPTVRSTSSVIQYFQLYSEGIIFRIKPSI